MGEAESLAISKGGLKSSSAGPDIFKEQSGRKSKHKQWSTTKESNLSGQKERNLAKNLADTEHNNCNGGPLEME